MADSEEWFVSEDGCLSIGQPVNGVTYHSSLNTVLVTTTEPAVKVIDVTSGVVLQSSNLSASKTDRVKCLYLPCKDKVLFSNGLSIGVRKDFNGMLLLDTGLQTPVSKTTDDVKVELPLPEANHLFKALMSTELPVADYVEDVLRELEKEIEATQQATKGNHKVAKWATVCVTLPHCALKTVCNNLVAELKRLNQHIPGLSVAFAVYDRLSYLLPSIMSDFGNGLVDRSLMYSEAARRETFSKWPHMNYKWALPDPMAQAGFYHQPSTTGDDRAMCFTCNVCLVCWEPTDEPWSEHERHSPSCAFVKGEYTQNVPLSVTYATEPAMLHGSKMDKIECVSSGVSEDFVATSTLHGNIVVWNIARQLKKHIQFNIDPLDPVITMKKGSRLTVSDDNAGESSKPTVKEFCPEVSPDDDRNSPSENSSSSGESKAQIIEVGGAWRAKGCSSLNEEIDDVPLDDIELIKESIQQSRPSQDVRVSSLCMLKTSSIASLQKITLGGSADAVATSGITPCLLSGVAIRTVCHVDLQTQLSAHEASSERNDVAAMNQVNEALSGSTTPQIILDSPGNLGLSSSDIEMNSFVPCLLVHDVSGGHIREEQTKDNESHLSQGFGVGKGTSVSCLQDLYMPQIVEMEEDPDVQIVGVTPPLGQVQKSMSSKCPEGLVNSVSPSSWLKNGTNSPGPSNSKGKESPTITHTSVSKGLVDGVSSPHSFLPPHRSGQVAQCIHFPDFVSCKQYVRCIVPSEDGKFIIVVLSPRLLKKDNPDMSTQFVLDSGENYDKITDVDGSVNSRNTESQSPSENASGGCILVYRLKLDGQILMLQDEPVKVLQIDNVNEAVISVLPLPLEVSTSQEEEELSPMHDYQGSRMDSDYVPGQIAVTTLAGSIRIISLDSMRVLAEVSPEEEDRFVSLAFCSGMDRLCACTAEGKLHFYLISPRHPDFSDCEMLQQNSPLRPASWTKDSDMMDGHVEVNSKQEAGEDLLVKQQLSTDTLSALHELTQFENLVPRFSATAPPCWTEIQQEQQQRRHPQHLQQRGEATRHTRTWRLQPESSSWDEHLFEMVLPRPCCIGHIDFKFTLHPLCTSPPNVQVTLLKQNITNIGRQANAEVDAKIHFNIKPGDKESASKSKINAELKTVNNVLDPQFLERHGAEILCGPVDLTTGVDLSGHCGMLTLTSPQLLKVKTRSLLLHIKALHSVNNDPVQKETKEKNVSNNLAPPTSHKDKTIKSLFEQFGMSSAMNAGGSMGSAADRLAASKQKLENIKGCDWFQEVSLTVRRMKKTSIPRDRIQRCVVLERPSFHEQLVATVCCQEDKQNLGSSTENRQSLALGILTWITYMQMNDPQERVDDSCIVYTVQSSLKALIKACFIEAGRSIAHKGARLLALVIEFTKNIKDIDVAPAFNYALLNALLDSLPLIPYASSAGSLHWYFILLNRVKFMDIDQTGQKCADLLITVAKYYDERKRPEHALLRARFGLYGNPLDPDLFDLEPPQVIKPGATSVGSYAAIVNNNNSVSSSSSEEIYYKDLMSISAEKSCQKSQTDQMKNLFCGLLEVEPLHFTCHATSDGTRMERMDSVGNVTLSSSLPISGLSGTINFTESLSSATAAGAALASLSTAMASAEQQLQMLQQKQQQLMKLQQQKQKLEQKLSETSKIIGSGSAASTQPSSGFSSYSSSPYMYSSELLPPTPKTTPLFMTPPVTPPNEHLQEADPGKPPSGKSFTKVSNGKTEAVQKASFPVPQNGQLLQPPAAQVLVIERMHSGARRFVVLDFGKPILLTDMIIPACSDLASLSVDVWVQGEESDGQRLVVSSDIGVRSLIMNDLMPPQICRFLKITTIGRSVGGTTRSRIPIGSFYGHSFILPWELDALQNNCVLSSVSSNAAASSNQMISNDQSQTLSQLSLLISLEEDIQCRYSLACNRLQAYLHALDSPTSRAGHTLYYLRNMKKSEDDLKITHAYNDCIQLQVQLNLAQRAILRLQKALGIKQVSVLAGVSMESSALREVCTDKLRVLMEHLLDCLLGMTNPSTSVPQLPVSLHSAFSQQVTEAIFKYLCIFGSKRMQVNGGTLLVRVCGTEAWWGELLGDILQEYFSSQFAQIFPQDRVFILLTALGQKALTGSSASQVLENILVVLVKLLSPLQTSQRRYHGLSPACLDLSLIGWVLLFLSRNLDSVAFNNNGGEDNDKHSTQGNSSRWDFILGESTMNIGRNNARSNSGKLYRRKLQKRLMHHKQQLLDLQQAKKKFLTTQLEKSSAVLTKEAENLMKQQEQEFKKHLKQYETKHFKDIMRIRRTDGEMLKKLPQESSGGGSEREGGGDTDGEPIISLSREKASAVARGLVALLLSMDFTCDVDLFLVTCKVIARLCTVTRPAIKLCEVMTQEELESLMILCGSIECNHENITWGGAWTGHAITCLLQDILEGERLFPNSVPPAEGITDDEMSGSVTESEEVLQTSTVMEAESESADSATSAESSTPSKKKKVPTATLR